MKYFLYLFILIFPFGQLLRWEPWGAESAIHFNDLALGIVLFSWLVIQGKNHKVLLKHWFVKPVLLWILAMVISLLLNLVNLTGKEVAISSLYLIRWAAYAGLFFVGVSQTEKVRKNLLRLMVLAGLITGLAGLTQYLFLPNVTFLSAQNWDDHYFRLVGSFLDPGFTGAILILFLILVFSLRNSLENFLFWIVGYVAMALTYSRATYLMFLFGASLSSIFRRRPKIILGAIALMLVTLMLLPVHPGEGNKLGREYSVWSRINNWKQSLSVWQKSPLFGVGFNSYRYRLQDLGILSQQGVRESHGGGADSSIMLVLATTGIIGLLAYLNLGRVILTRQKNLLIWSSFLGIFVHSWFNNTLFYPWVMEWLWLLLALTVEDKQ